MTGLSNYTRCSMIVPENITQGRGKEIVQLTQSILYPPRLFDPPPTSRDKPLHCKTVIVTGFPKEATKGIIKEIFDRCGEINRICLFSEFCFITFCDEAFVENAIYFSGYRIKIENKNESSYNGQLHVDYGEVKYEQFKYERKQRPSERSARESQMMAKVCNRSGLSQTSRVPFRARERLDTKSSRPTFPSGTVVVDYSERDVSILGDKLKEEETFMQAVFVLNTWLKRGECNKGNFCSFYSMIETCILRHVRRLVKEVKEMNKTNIEYKYEINIIKMRYEDEINVAKIRYEDELNNVKLCMQNILLQFNEIENLINTACLQKVWDHFTKAQRKSIEFFKKKTEHVKNDCIKEIISQRIEDEMDISEGEEVDENVTKMWDNSELKNKYEVEFDKLRDENNSLRCQLESAQTELYTVHDCNNTNKTFESCTSTKDISSSDSNNQNGSVMEVQNTYEQNENELNKLREEMDILRWELNKAQNETIILRSQLDAKDHHIQTLEQAFLNAKKKVI